jgi:hypothetical protein
MSPTAADRKGDAIVRQRRRFAVAVLGGLAIAGCATQEIKPHRGAEMELPWAYPETEVKKDYAWFAKTKGLMQVAALSISNGGIAQAQKSGAGNLALNEVERRVAESGAVLVDRSLATALEPIILECEARGGDCGQAEYGGETVADMAISGKITSAQVTSQFFGEQVVEKKGKRQVTPARCEFSGSVSAMINLYNVNPLAHVKTLVVDGRAGSSRETNDSRCPMADSEVDGLIASAIRNAVTANAVEVKNYFSPKGMIFRGKAEKQNTYLQVTLPANSVEPGTAVKVFRLEKAVHPMTGLVTLEEHGIGEAQIVKAEGENKEAWIQLTRLEEGQEVMKGDRIRVEFKRDLKEFLREVSRNLSP